MGVKREDVVDRLSRALTMGREARDAGQDVSKVRELAKQARAALEAGGYEKALSHSNEILAMLGGLSLDETSLVHPKTNGKKRTALVVGLALAFALVAAPMLYLLASSQLSSNTPSSPPSRPPPSATWHTVTSYSGSACDLSLYYYCDTTKQFVIQAAKFRVQYSFSSTDGCTTFGIGVRRVGTSSFPYTSSFDCYGSLSGVLNVPEGFGQFEMLVEWDSASWTATIEVWY